MEEMKAFDTKVYGAQVEMVKQMAAKMATMGIPFFGTKPELVRPKDDVAGPEDEKKKGTVSERELQELQRKMLELLEDLAKD